MSLPLLKPPVQASASGRQIAQRVGFKAWRSGQDISEDDLENWHIPKNHLSHEKIPGCLGYIGDYTTQLNRDYNRYNRPGSLLNNQYNGK